MNASSFSEAMGELDVRYIDEALGFKRRAKWRVWAKRCAVAACLAAVIAAALPLVRTSQDKLPTEALQIFEFNGSLYEVVEDAAILRRLGIDPKITEADAGEAVAYLTKLPAVSSGYTVAAGPTDIVLYSYVKAPCGAVYVLCDSGEYSAVVFCNFVLRDTESLPLGRLYERYGVESSADIASISVVNGWFEKRVVGAVLTDGDAIADFYSTSLALQNYSNDEHHNMKYGHIATEEELVKAYERTDENKVTVMLETADGLRFCLEYDGEGGWLYSGETLSYYKATAEMAAWFSNNLID